MSKSTSSWQDWSAKMAMDYVEIKTSDLKRDVYLWHQV